MDELRHRLDDDLLARVIDDHRSLEETGFRRNPVFVCDHCPPFVVIEAFRVGLAFPQIQKYERGANRISASRLFQFSRILNVPISFFFEEIPAGLKTVEDQAAVGLREQEQTTVEPDPLARRETMELVRAYYRISDPRVRKRLFEFTKSLANAKRDN